MKINSLKWVDASHLLFFLVLLLVISTANQKVYGQSTIYKSDGTTVKALYLTKQGASRSYKLANDSTGMIYYISWKAIDSIRYEDGTLEKFLSEAILPNIETHAGNGKNLLGINIWPLFMRNIEVFYDRLIIKDKVGLKSSLIIKAGENDYAGSYYNSMIYAFSSGINYYFLQSDLFRFGTGAAFIYGSFNEHYTDYYGYDSQYYPDYLIKKNHADIFLNGSFTIKIQKHFYTSLELDVPLLWNHPYTVLFKTEVAINF